MLRDPNVRLRFKMNEVIHLDWVKILREEWFGVCAWDLDSSDHLVVVALNSPCNTRTKTSAEQTLAVCILPRRYKAATSV